MSNSLDDLKKLAARLNEASDELTRTLHEIQDKLNTLHLGLDVWLNHLIYTEKSTGTTPPSTTPTVDSGFDLGFSKTEKGWGLATRRIRIESGFFEGDTRCPYSNFFNEGEPVSIFEAPRHVRLAALRYLPDLVAKLKQAAESVLTDIEEAKQLARNL